MANTVWTENDIERAATILAALPISDEYIDGLMGELDNCLKCVLLGDSTPIRRLVYELARVAKARTDSRRTN